MNHLRVETAANAPEGKRDMTLTIPRRPAGDNATRRVRLPRKPGPVTLAGRTTYLCSSQTPLCLPSAGADDLTGRSRQRLLIFIITDMMSSDIHDARPEKRGTEGGKIGARPRRMTHDFVGAKNVLLSDIDPFA